MSNVLTEARHILDRIAAAAGLGRLSGPHGPLPIDERRALGAVDLPPYTESVLRARPGLLTRWPELRRAADGQLWLGYMGADRSGSWSVAGAWLPVTEAQYRAALGDPAGGAASGTACTSRSRRRASSGVRRPRDNS